MNLNESNAKLVWEYFYALSAQPRPSKHEEKALVWLKAWAFENKFQCRQDASGNLLIEIPPSDGYENSPSVCLQAHVDMVCEKTPQNPHDFLNDPLKLREVDGWVMASDTTLGADNGAGIALAMAAAVSEKCKHPMLELLFTVDEETGLSGAEGIEPDFFKSEQMINLDSEDESFIIGCVGGQECELRLAAQWKMADESLAAFEISVGGLTGGHSGTDIHCQRASANKLLARILAGLDENEVAFSLAQIKGGSARNAIARDSRAVVLIEKTLCKKAEEIVAKITQNFKDEFATTDPNLSVKFSSQNSYGLQVLEESVCEKLIETLLAIPHGAVRFCSDFEGVVETSNNLAIIGISEDKQWVEIHALQRSCRLSQLDYITELVASIGELAGARVNILGRYPSWQPSKESPLLEKCKKLYAEINGKEAKVEIIHAGLECGLIGDKFPGIDMISFGPVIHNAHSPQEKLSIASVEENWKFLINLLGSLK